MSGFARNKRSMNYSYRLTDLQLIVIHHLCS
jgi:hypothetical protein